MGFSRPLLLRISLRRFFAYVSIVCVVSGAIAQYPDVVVAVGQYSWSALRLLAFASVLVAPSVLVCYAYATNSRNPRLSCFVTASGVCMGVYLSPGLAENAERLALWVCGVRWRSFAAIDIIDYCVPPIAALLVGGVGWWVIQLANSKTKCR